MSCKNRGPLSKSRVRRLCNDPNNLVDDYLMGMAMVHHGLVILDGCRTILRRDYNDMPGKVKLLSGGGAGNEPSHAGFVGPGMLTAAISGNIFSAPPSNIILRVIEELAMDHAPGVLMIVQNYTGYRINFGLAKLRAENKGLLVKMIIVEDDTCLKTFEKTAGRRGLAATLFLHKVAGAMAEEGRKLDEIYSVCDNLISGEEIATIGVCVKLPFPVGVCACIQDPASAQIDIGYGIHGEPGVMRVQFSTTENTVSQLLNVMMEKIGGNIAKLDVSGGDNVEVAVIISDLGGCSQLETGIFVMEVIRQLGKWNVKVVRAYVGSLMTSLDISGFQFSLMRLPPDSNLKKYLDAPTSAPAWPNVFCLKDLGLDWENTETKITTEGKCSKEEYGEDLPEVEPRGPQIQGATVQAFLTILIFACEALIACAEQVNLMDEDSGDGDCGTTLARGASAIKAAIKSNRIMGSRPFVAFTQIGYIIEKIMGGLQGGLYSLFFNAAARSFAEHSSEDPIDARVWLSALDAANKAVAEYGKATEGDRTMLDPLIAARNKLSEALEANHHPIQALGEAVKAAEDRAIETTRMSAVAGRASLVKCKRFEYPDPGAHAVGIWMRATYEGVKLKLSCQCDD